MGSSGSTGGAATVPANPFADMAPSGSLSEPTSVSAWAVYGYVS